MKASTEEEPPPTPNDLEGWRRAIGDGRLKTFPMETVVAAIQDLGPNTDKEVINALVIHTSDTLLRILAGLVGKNHWNEGKDIVEATHGQLIVAVFDSKSADGKGLRDAFVPRVKFRMLDALRADKKRRKRERPVEEINEVADAEHAGDCTLQKNLDERLYVEEVLSHITDDRKRLAFRLHMEGIPLESERSASIEKAVGVSAKTAGKWIEEVQTQLKPIVGGQS